jgi:hypothetical protein
MTKFFTIDSDNCLSVETDLLQTGLARQGEVYFATQEELASLTEALPVGRLVEVWNSFAGAPPFEDLKDVKRVTDRKTAVSRIWHAAERLCAQVEKDEATKDTTAKDDATGAKAPREGSKTAQVVAMLERKTGATLAEIMTRMGWHLAEAYMEENKYTFPVIVSKALVESLFPVAGYPQVWIINAAGQRSSPVRFIDNEAAIRELEKAAAAR